MEKSKTGTHGVQPILHSFHLGDVALGWSTQFSLTWCLDLKRTKKKEKRTPPRNMVWLPGTPGMSKVYKAGVSRHTYICIYIYIHERSCRCWLHEALQLNPTRILHLNPSPRSGRKSDCIAMVPTTINDQPKPQAGGMKDPPSPSVSSVAGQKCSVGLGA
jgi:hypothetical protein